MFARERDELLRILVICCMKDVGRIGMREVCSKTVGGG